MLKVPNTLVPTDILFSGEPVEFAVDTGTDARTLLPPIPT